MGSLQPVWFRWLVFILNLLTAIICVRIVYQEYQKVRTSSNNHENKYQKLLTISAFSVYILCTIYHILRMIRAFDCDGWAMTTNELSYFIMKIFITFYQIARLQYCFSAEQVHSKYGYSKYVFIWLYIHGVAILLFAIIDSSLEITSINGKYNVPYICHVVLDKTHSNWFNIGRFSWYVAWDVTVLVLYTWKCYQFYKKQRLFGNIDKSIVLRIKFILSKILFLTLLIFMESGILITLYYLDYSERSIASAVVYNICAAFVGLIDCYLIYLMRSHNDEQYIKFLMMLDNLKICICFKCFIDYGLHYTEKQRADQDHEKRRNTINTKTNVGKLPERMQTEMSAVSQV